MRKRSKPYQSENACVIAQIEVKANPPTLRDFHEVEEMLEPTVVLDMPPDYAAIFERTERPTIPIGYHPLPNHTLTKVILHKQNVCPTGHNGICCCSPRCNGAVW